jgi:hypothetical protein
MRKFTVPILATALFLAGVYAVSAAGLRISPAFIEEKLEPGQSVTKVISVTNAGKTEESYTAVVRDVDSMDERGGPIWTDPNVEKSGAELSSWTTFSIQRITLAPEQTAEVAVTFTVPADAPNGGFFGMVGLEQEAPELQEGQSAIGIGFTTGTLVSLRVGEEAFDDAILRSFRSLDRLSGAADTVLETRIENTGNALIRPTGIIEISDMFGEVVSSVSFNPEAGAILPGAVRRYETTWQGEGLHLGRYEAFLVVGYGDTEKKTLTATTSFWVIPGKLSLVVGGIAVIFFLIVFGWARVYIRRRLKGAGAPASSGGASSGTIFLAALIAVIVTAVVLFGFAFFFLI